MREVNPLLQQSGKRAEGASIVSEVLVRYIGSRGRQIVCLLAALGLLLAGCSQGGGQGQAQAPCSPRRRCSARPRPPSTRPPCARTPRAPLRTLPPFRRPCGQPSSSRPSPP